MVTFSASLYFSGLPITFALLLSTYTSSHSLDCPFFGYTTNFSCEKINNLFLKNVLVGLGFAEELTSFTKASAMLPAGCITDPSRHCCCNFRVLPLSPSLVTCFRCNSKPPKRMVHIVPGLIFPLVQVRFQEPLLQSRPPFHDSFVFRVCVEQLRLI